MLVCFRARWPKFVFEPEELSGDLHRVLCTQGNWHAFGEKVVLVVRSIHHYYYYYCIS